MPLQDPSKHTLTLYKEMQANTCIFCFKSALNIWGDMDMQEDKIAVSLIPPFCNYCCEHFDPYPSNYMVYMLHTWASGIYYKEAPWNFGIARNCSLS